MTPPPDIPETILENIHDGVYTLDAEGRITWVNRTAVEEHDIGYDADELIGSYVSKVLSDEDIEKCLEIIRDCLRIEDRDSGRCEIALQTAYGTEIPCELHLALLPMDDGEFQGSVGVVRDITARKRREERLQVLNRVLRHNLNNEMNVVIGNAELLEKGVAEDQRKHARAIREAGERLVELGRKARQAGELQELADDDRRTIDLAAVVEEELAAYREAYPDLTIELERPQTPAELLGHKALLTTALGNLLENSIEHNDASRPRIEVTISTSDDLVEVAVTDNGPGIPETELAVIEAGAESQLRHGTGVGLWLAHWCTTAAGGDLTFETSPAGTTVSLEVPRA